MVLTEPWQLRMPRMGTRLKADTALRKGLVGCWLYNEFGQERITDLSGNGNHGVLTLSSTLFWAASVRIRGPALHSAARLGSARIVIPTITLSTYSFATWLVSQPSGDAYECLLTQGASAGFFLSGAPRRLNLFSAGDHLATTGVVPGALTLVGASALAGSGVVDFYYNGEPDGSAALTVPTLLLDSISNDSGSETYGGELILQMLWNRKLDASEFMALYG